MPAPPPPPSSSTDEVLVHDDGGVRALTLNRPSRLNAFTATSYRRLADRLIAAAADDDVRVVVLGGAGRAFSSGVDLEEAGPEQLELLSETFGVLLDALITFPKPLIAGVHGVAVGFGFTLLLHCDVVVVADDARLRAPFTALGTAPEAGSSLLLPQLVGRQRAAEIVLTARWVSGAEAVGLGLAAQCCPAAEVPEQALAVARQIGAHAPSAVVAAKRLLRDAQADAVRAALQRERREAGRLRELLGPLPRLGDLPRRAKGPAAPSPAQPPVG